MCMQLWGLRRRFWARSVLFSLDICRDIQARQGPGAAGGLTEVEDDGLGGGWTGDWAGPGGGAGAGHTCTLKGPWGSRAGTNPPRPLSWPLASWGWGPESTALSFCYFGDCGYFPFPFKVYFDQQEDRLQVRRGTNCLCIFTKVTFWRMRRWAFTTRSLQLYSFQQSTHRHFVFSKLIPRSAANK